MSKEVMIAYTNWRGERRNRPVMPLSIAWTSSKWHPEEQWVLIATDLEDGKQKEFPLANIHGWTPCQ